MDYFAEWRIWGFEHGVASLYKGKEFYIGQHHSHHFVAAHKAHMLRGTLFLVGSMCSYTAWFIIQVCIYFSS